MKQTVFYGIEKGDLYGGDIESDSIPEEEYNDITFFTSLDKAKEEYKKNVESIKNAEYIKLFKRTTTIKLSNKDLKEIGNSGYCDKLDFHSEGGFFGSGDDEIIDHAIMLLNIVNYES